MTADVHVKVSVHDSESLSERRDRDEKILNDMMQLVESTQFFCLKPLHDGNVWRHGPPEQVTEPDVVAKGHNVANLPKETARVSVVVPAK